MEEQFISWFCFLESMVSTEINTQNPQMKAPELKVGVITPPDNFVKPVIYSDREASKKFQELKSDVYQKQNKVSFEKTKKTPKSVFYLVGGLILTGLGFLIKARLKKKA